MSFDVIVVGDLFRDVIMTGFSSLPLLGEEGFARRLEEDAGGGAAITACGLARLGVRTAIMGVVGRDDVFPLEGVDASLMRRHPTEPSGMTVSVSTLADRALFTYRGANSALPELLRHAETLQVLGSARHVHFACALDPHTDLLRLLAVRGCTTSIDVGWHPEWLSNSASLNLLRTAGIFFPNEREAAHMTRESEPEAMLDCMERAGLPNVVLKLGPKGAISRIGEQRYRALPPEVSVADTTGAGDAFDAGYIYGLVRAEAPAACLRIANLCGALSTRALGGIRAFPTLQELDKQP